MNLPNQLTMARIFAVPFFVIAYMKEMFLVAFVIFILASITDMLDGKIARKYNLITNFGKIMDPLADKILVYAAFCLMVENQTIPSFMLIVILAREFLVSGIRTVAAVEGVVIAAAMSGKIKTVLQMIAVPLLLMINIPQLADFYKVIYYAAYGFLWASFVMTIVSGIEYAYSNRSVFLN
ncbi:MAG: CDP-diacylglycerol--glycerol-3-phosphate 3-phosphatidyltransferase [Eubacteriales bacterium]